MIAIEQELTGTMLVFCAWCRPVRKIGERRCVPANDGKVSHGICLECVAVARGELVGRCVEIGPDPEGAR
jgi:hypothetical protein